ncbi:MAG: hypothetical protein N2560_07950 [Ignavibacteria bacterium]|nr:hypothetical protein [Ignavibacteria bacterium]
MLKVFLKIICYFWKRNFYIAKKIKLGGSKEEFAIASVFLTTIFFLIGFASLLFFLQVEKKYLLDVKLISIILFILLSSCQFLFLFNTKKRYQLLDEVEFSIHSILFFLLIWILIFIFLAISMIFDHFDGNIDSFLKYIKDNYGL